MPAIVTPVTHQPFSVARLRSGLLHFVVGKAASAVIGIGWLLVLVRALGVNDYAGYVILLAALEIGLLVTNAGVYPFAQRYVTEARLPANVSRLTALVWGSFAYRILTLAMLAGVMAIWPEEIAGVLRSPILAGILPMYAAIIVVEGSIRYLELVFESLLEQGKAQLSAVARNGLRVIAVLALWHGQETLNLHAVIAVELICSSLGLFLGVLLMRQSLGKYANQAVIGDRPADFSLRRLWPFAAPLFVAQCATQIYSPDAIKLIVSRLFGAVEAASFGFAHAISFVLQRYLPAQLLLGLIRPMLVARQQQAGAAEQLNLVGGLVLKINLLLLLAPAAVFAVAGSEFTAWLSGGRYPGAGPILFLLTLLLILNGTHIVLSMLATTLENSRAVLWGTLVSIPGVFIGVALAPKLGAIAMVLGLWASELAWCGLALVLLRSGGLTLRFDVGAWLKLLAAAAVAALASMLLREGLALQGRAALLSVAGVALPVYALLAWRLKPFRTDEQALMRKLLPHRRGGAPATGAP